MKPLSGMSPGRLPDDLPGLDIAAFRVMLRGNEDMVRKLLGGFCNSYDGQAREIADLVVAGDFENAIRAIHTLKGVSGNLRATRVFEASAALEAALRTAPDGPETAPLLSDLDGALNEVMAGLRRALGASG
jgi:HPt (histidine-containing phosphotransfer) domain-containing protein